MGRPALFLIDGTTFAISAITVFLIRWRPPLREAVQQQAESLVHGAQIVWQQTIDGFKTIVRSRLLQVALLLGFSLNLLIAPIQVLMPLFVTEVKHEGPSYFSLLVGGLLLGLISGSLLSPALARRGSALPRPGSSQLGLRWRSSPGLRSRSSSRLPAP